MTYARDVCDLLNVPRLAFEDELLSLQSDDNLRRRCRNQSVEDQWSMIDMRTLRKVFATILSMFGSTYLCEQTFSSMKLIKNKMRNRLTDSNLEAELRCAVTSLDPRIDSLVRSSTNRASSDAFAE